jgi:hypothetical protein
MTSNEAHPLYKIDKRLKTGDKNALFEIASYFDSKKELVERFAYNHISANNESEVAKRIVEVNSIFTDTEIIIDENTSSQDFLKFLNANLKNIVYSEYANAFLITPLEKRSVKIRFREITDEKRLNLVNEYQSILSSLENPEIETLIKSKDSKTLFIIASELFKERNWLNTFSYGSKTGEYVKLLQILTNFEIEVEGDYNKMTWHIEEEFYPKAALNLLCYFSANYSMFKWNEEKKIFENNDIEILSIGKESSLFQLLGSENDSMAIDAFVQLTTCSIRQVIDLANEYESARIDNNYSLPTFPYRFLKQLVELTDYCKSNSIDFVGTKELRRDIELLKSKLSFSERRKLENRLIHSLTLDDITAFEYWALIYEKSWGLTYSAGRILDVFYSKNWNTLLYDNKYLDCYLKKSMLFDNLGIIGVCNNYLTKFTNLQEVGIEKLNKLESKDKTIKSQIEKAKVLCKLPIISPNDTMKINVANYDFEVRNLSQSILKISKIEDYNEMEDSLTDILSKIAYNQIGEAMKEIENIKYKEFEWKKYSFLERDFGFFIYGNFDSIATRNEFLLDYMKFSELEFYKNMLTKAGTEYFNQKNEIDYDKIYDALKYNVVVAFVGGGGGRDDNEVYAVIKLLELTHNTTLGYPKKLCNSNGIYGCNSQDRANYWMQYLIDKGLLKYVHKEPVSFHYE